MDWDCKTVDVYTHEQDGHEEVIYNVHSAMIEGWVKDAMGEEAVTALEVGLDQQIENEKNPTSVTKTIEN